MKALLLSGTQLEVAADEDPLRPVSLRKRLGRIAAVVGDCCQISRPAAYDGAETVRQAQDARRLLRNHTVEAGRGHVPSRHAQLVEQIAVGGNRRVASQG